MLKRTGIILAHIVFWLMIFMLPHLITYGTINTRALFTEPGYIIHPVSTVLLIGYAYFNHYTLVPKLYLHRRYLLYALIVIVAVLVVIWLPQVFGRMEARHHFNIPPEMDHHFGPDHHHDHRGMGGPGGIPKMSYNIILFIICTFASISIRQQRALLEIQKEKLDAEVSFLKAQINPHFLFNTLNSIYALSIRKSDDTPKAITQLSELMRYILKDSDSDTVPLDKEINYINNYVELQRRRLGNTVRINYKEPNGGYGLRIAPLILMSFVENAFKHGVNPGEDCQIDIAITVDGSRLQLLVMNNKVKGANREEAMGIGLKNASSRLEHLYPGKHTLTIEDWEKTFAVQLTMELQ